MINVSGLYRNTDCGALRLGDDGKKVKLAGWVQRTRDHGGVIFIDLRDRSGLIQVVFNPETVGELMEEAHRLRSEFVVSVEGNVRKRPEGTENSQLLTGDIEVLVSSMHVLSVAETPPFMLDEADQVDESLKLKYRYLDLRRPEMMDNLILRHRFVKRIRDILDDNGFLEIETPVLTKSTPEGARDYLVPSRTQPGHFFALPQSPQLFKQLLMVSGVEKYFQIAKCFRDEDLRADRQPEFTQIDIEMSFVTRDDVMAVADQILLEAFEIIGQKAPVIERLEYEEAMTRFGSDRPDIRYGLELKEVSDIVVSSEFSVFRSVVEGGGSVISINIGNTDFSRKDFDDLVKEAVTFGAKGLAWITVEDGKAKSPIAKFFKQEEIDAIFKALEAKEGDTLIFVADNKDICWNVLGNLRPRLAERFGLIKENEYAACWVIDFPLFKRNEDENRYEPHHHPFTAPKSGHIDPEKEPETILADAYDLVLNGTEIAGGSIRIHDRKMQSQVFDIIGISEEVANARFGFLLKALQYGTPPHGGIAFGLDRLTMIMAGRDSIRDVIAFPKTQGATDLLAGAPDTVDPKQLRDLNIKTTLE